jgi:transposase-like protein
MAALLLSAADRQLLLKTLEDTQAPRVQTRARVVLALASGVSDREVARKVGVARQTVALWRSRVLSAGGAGVIKTDAPGRGRKPSVPADVRKAIRAAWQVSARTGSPRSVRDLARQFGLSPATVHRALKTEVPERSAGQ